MDTFYNQRPRSQDVWKSVSESKIEQHKKSVADYMSEVYNLDYGHVMSELGQYYPGNVSVGGVTLTPAVRAEYAQTVHDALMAAHTALCKLQVTLNPRLANLSHFSGKHLTDKELAALKWIPAIANDLVMLMNDPKLEFHFAQLSSLVAEFSRPGYFG